MYNGLFPCKVDNRAKSRNVTKHACIYKEGSSTNRFGSKQLLNFCAFTSQKFLTNSRVIKDTNRLTLSGYEMRSNVKRTRCHFSVAHERGVSLIPILDGFHHKL